MKLTAYIIRRILIGCIVTSSIACKESDPDAAEYFKLINKAEMEITRNDFQSAAEHYDMAFKIIEKPFGKDVYNAVIVNSEIEDREKVLAYTQVLVNNSEDFSFIDSTLVGMYILREDWNMILSHRKISYDEFLRKEMENVKELDQQFRPHYEIHMDTIETIRQKNLKRIANLSSLNGLPGHQEIGYTRKLRNQPHHIVLHHTAQRRSQDKNVKPLDSILKKAVQQGKIDPEQAIQFLKYQNTLGAGPYEVYTIFRVQHPLLPDSLQNKVLKMKLREEEKFKVDSVRKEWYASTFDDLALKADFLNNTQHPFIFTGVHNAIYQLPYDLSEEEAIKQYETYVSGWTEN